MSALTIIITSEYSWGPQLIFCASFNTWTYCTDSPNYLVHFLLFRALFKILEVVLWPASQLVIFWAVCTEAPPALGINRMQIQPIATCNTMHRYFVTVLIFLIKLQGTSEWGFFSGIFCLFSINTNLFSSVLLISVTVICDVQDHTRLVSYARQEFYSQGFPLV